MAQTLTHMLQSHPPSLLFATDSQCWKDSNSDGGPNTPTFHLLNKRFLNLETFCNVRKQMTSFGPGHQHFVVCLWRISSKLLQQIFELSVFVI